MKAQSMSQNVIIENLMGQLKINKVMVDQNKDIALYFNLIKDSLLQTKPVPDNTF